MWINKECVMKNNRSALLWGGLLIVLGVGFLLESFGLIRIMSSFIWAVALVGISLPFWIIYLSERDQWWALFPGSILAGVGLGVLFGGSWAGIIITASVGLPFWLLYLTDRGRWWALIPGWTMLCVSLIILLDWLGLDWFIGPFVMFAIAAPFLLVYVLNREQWWALIPGGIMAAIGFAVLLAEITRNISFWPIFLILFGAWLIYRAYRPQRESPVGSDADVSRFDPPEPPEPSAEPEEPR
jgi:hypothetical protein